MLILNRNTNESVRIGAMGEIVVRVLQTRGKQVKLGIEAPGNVPIYREELLLKNNKSIANHETNFSMDLKLTTGE